MNVVTLNNGIRMPQLGFGVFKVEDDQATSCSKKRNPSWIQID